MLTCGTRLCEATANLARSGLGETVSRIGSQIAALVGYVLVNSAGWDGAVVFDVKWEAIAQPCNVFTSPDEIITGNMRCNTTDWCILLGIHNDVTGWTRRPPGNYTGGGSCRA